MSVDDAGLSCPTLQLGNKDLPSQLLGRLLADGLAVDSFQQLPSAEGSHITHGSMLSPKVICIQKLGNVGGQVLQDLPRSIAPHEFC